MPNHLEDLTVACVSLVDRAAVRDPSNPTEPQRLLVWKRDDQGGTMPPSATEDLAAALQKADLPDSVREAIEKASERESALQTATADLTKARGEIETLKAAAKPKPANDDDDDDKLDLSKADLHPSVRAMIEKGEQDRKALADRLEKAEKAAAQADEIAKAEQDKRVLGEFVKKAETEFAHLGDASELGSRLHRLSKALSAEDFDAELTSMRAQNAQVAKAEKILFTERGLSGQPVSKGETDPVAKVDAKVAELRKADPSLSQFQAMQRAMRDPDIHAAYEDSVR